MMLSIQPLSQRDSKWTSQTLGNVKSTTIGSHGCVITAMAMLCSYYNHSLTPNKLNDFLNQNNLYYDGNLFVNGSISRLFNDVKFDKVIFCEDTPAPIDEIKRYLDRGMPMVVALINQGIRHYVLVVGHQDNKIFANDPWQGDTVAINDRWGDPASKILQVNFFSGIVAGVTTNVVDTPSVNTDQMLDYKKVIAGLENDLQNARNKILRLEQGQVQSQDPTKPTIIAYSMGDFLNSMKSRKFLLAVVGALVPILNSTFSLGVTQDQVIAILTPLVAFIGMEGLADAFERGKVLTPKTTV